MNIFNILNLRTEFESIISKGFVLPGYNSDINSLRWFIRNGRRRNGLRNDFDRAAYIAKTINEANDEQLRRRRGWNNNKY